MHKRLLPQALILIISLFICPQAARANADSFSFDSFTADYFLSRDTRHVSQLTVRETLVARFPDTDQNHGIVRALPKSYLGHSTNLRIISVTDKDGLAIPYTSSTNHDNLILKIGRADQYVHGHYTYHIEYTQDNITTKPNTDHDGYYWDINGDQWPQRFTTVTARIHLTPDIAPLVRSDQLRCYTGVSRSTDHDCIISRTDSQLITATTSRALESKETLTTEIDFAPDTFAAYKRPASEILLLAAFIVLGCLLPVVVALWATLHRWRRFGRDPRGRSVIVPEYLPPKNTSVLSANAILRESFQPKAVSAQIIDLAVRHYLKIYEAQNNALFVKNTTYEIELIRRDDQLKPEEVSVIDILYGSEASIGSRVRLSELANKLYKPAAELGKTINTQLTARGYFRSNPDQAKLPFLITGIILLFGGFLLVTIAPGISIAGLICIIMSQIMPARTQAGVEIRDHLLGLKHYMSLAEADRIRALQSPHGELTEKINTNDKTQLIKLYERLLPYAILFGIEQDWAKEFAPLYETQPDWYSGVQGFHAASFVHSLAAFDAASTASFTSPSSSSSGGSAGGGGGGGGGGGW